MVEQAANVLDPNALTLGFARRFTGYKRPNLLLADPARLARLLNDPARPVQLGLAGKAHPDDEGKEMIREWVDLAQQSEFRRRVVFLEDYDIALAQELVQGVDVWINTPRRPWEACGTSGMKVLVNGGLNLSERDGWWEEAYAPELGWAIGDDGEYAWGERDAEDAAALYAILEQEVVPEFYARDAAGMPRRWLERMRRSMAALTRPTAAAEWRAIMLNSITWLAQSSWAAALPKGVSRHGRCRVGRLGCVGTGRGFISARPAAPRRRGLVFRGAGLFRRNRAG
ncbi:MAG TPA: alpha-glucan family phosphorylase [Stellaceae bacterium]|nr:alpha-glucan family phosphorylase [Stellaceae bacterium]